MILHRQLGANLSDFCVQPCVFAVSIILICRSSKMHYIQFPRNTPPSPGSFAIRCSLSHSLVGWHKSSERAWLLSPSSAHLVPCIESPLFVHIHLLYWALLRWLCQVSIFPLSFLSLVWEQCPLLARCASCHAISVEWRVLESTWLAICARRTQ